MLEKVDEFNETEEDMKRCEAALVCNGMEFDVNGPQINVKEQILINI